MPAGRRRMHRIYPDIGGRLRNTHVLALAVGISQLAIGSAVRAAHQAAKPWRDSGTTATPGIRSIGTSR